MLPHSVSLKKPSGRGPSRVLFSFLRSATERACHSCKNKKLPARCAAKVREPRRTKANDSGRNAPPPHERRDRGSWRHPSKAADYPFMERNWVARPPVLRPTQNQSPRTRGSGALIAAGADAIASLPYTIGNERDARRHAPL
ncbi:hypothetical protein MTO96_001264 [Rhipicephalus appendiculatus]